MRTLSETLSSVRKLYLGKDSIDDEGVSLIAESLKGPCQLSELRLHDNKIGTNSEESALHSDSLC